MESPRAGRGRPARDLRHRAIGDDVALVQDQHAGAVLLDLGQEVRAEEHGRSAFARDPSDVREHLLLPCRIEAERRLVEEYDIGVVHERPGDAKALAHAAAVRGNERLLRSNSPTSSSSAAAVVAALALDMTVEASVVAEVLLAGLPLGVAVALRQHADPLANLRRAGVGMPATVKLPLLGEKIVVRTRIAVVLPAPFGPSTPSTSPGSTANVRSVHGEMRSVSFGDSVRLDGGTQGTFRFPITTSPSTPSTLPPNRASVESAAGLSEENAPPRTCGKAHSDHGATS